MRRALLLALMLVLAGCGKTKTVTLEPEPITVPVTTTTPVDPGEAALVAFADAARRGKADRLWDLLSTSSKDRLGPTLERFRKGTASKLAEVLGAFTRYRTIVSERITPEFGVVAIDGMRDGNRAV